MKNKNIILLIIAIVIIAVAIYFSTKKNTSTTSSEILYSNSINYDDTVQKVTDYAKLKDIFDGSGIVVFVDEHSNDSVNLINAIEEYAKQYNAKIYCVIAKDFKNDVSDLNASSIYEKISKVETSYASDGTLNTPDLFGIKDGVIFSHILGFDSSLSKDKIKEIYAENFANVTLSAME
jgi:hypothetical protein